MEKTILTKEERQRFFETINQKSDRFMGVSLVVLFFFGLFLATFYDTYFIAIGAGLFSLAAYFLTQALLPNFSLHRYVASGVLAIFTAQFIYQMHGLFELHFFVFIGSALLITYQNWKLQLPLILLVVIHHASFAYIQYLGMKEIYFTQLDYMSLQTFIFHAALAAVIVGICGYWAFDLEQKTIISAINTLALEKQLTHVKRNVAFAEEISKGNLEVSYNLEEGTDELGKALATMRENLRQAHQREQGEKFITLGITKIGDIVRQHPDNVNALADAFVKGVVKYMNISQGGLFLHEKEGDKEYLNMVSCYAFERKKFLKNKIEVGEGLVGQCFLERDSLYLTNVPDDYIRITSGLGGANPSCLLIVPVMTSEEIVGVLELASFKPLGHSEMEFVKKATENIASSIISTKVTGRIKFLLEESQQQAEEMKAQEEEMRQNMEELQATQEEMERKHTEEERIKKELKEREDALSMCIIHSETDLHGTITYVNDKFCQVSKYKREELLGKPHNIVRHPDMPPALFELMWDTIKSGKVFHGLIKNKAKDGSIYWVDATIVPVKDPKGKTHKYIGSRYHITDASIAEMLYQKQMKHLGLPLSA